MGNFTSQLLFFLLFFNITAFSQDSLRIGTKFVPIPELSFNTDNGLKIAGEVQLYNYGFNSVKPFESFSRYRISYSSIGAFSLLASNDDVNVFGSDTRVFYYGFMSRNLADYYFGDTDKQDYDAARYDSSDYYNFDMMRIDFGALIRSPIGTWNEGVGVEFKKGLAITYERPLETLDSDFIETDNVSGQNGALLTIVELGLIYDRRNSEFRAGNGILLDIGSKYSLPFVSRYHGLQNYFTALGFIPITKKLFDITLATRFSFINTIGEKPYWLTPALGGSGTMRGFIYRRFSSDNAISYSAELRSWLFSIPNSNMEFGGHIFIDGGRVFSNENWKSILTNHRYALGFGGVMSIFTPDFLLKAEIGFSEDGTGIYLGTGYSF